MIGILIGKIIGLIIALIPVILILKSKWVSGKTKIIWGLIALIVPYILKEFVFAVVYVLQAPVMLNGWAPAIPLTWYISAWLIYFYFKKKYKPAKDTITT
ncbi:MAG: hypothetical protein AB1389_05145 [Campylobacterota bacterium]